MATYSHIRPYNGLNGGEPVIWTIGDSILCADGYQGGWRGILYRALVTAGFVPNMIGGLASATYDIPPLAEAVAGLGHNGNRGASTSGWQSSYYNTYRPGLSATPNQIILALGGNDNDTVGNGVLLGSLIDMAVADYPKAVIWAATVIPHLGNPMSTLAGEVRSQVATRIAAGKNVRLLDFNALRSESEWTNSLTYDGLHPNQAGHNILGAYVVSRFLSVLS